MRGTKYCFIMYNHSKYGKERAGSRYELSTGIIRNTISSFRFYRHEDSLNAAGKGNERGFVLLPVLILLTLLLTLILMTAEAFVSEKKFAEESRSRMMTDHLLRLAKQDSADYLASDLPVGYDGILYYENGDVYFRILDISEQQCTVQLYATSILDGKAETTHQYGFTGNTVLQ